MKKNILWGGIGLLSLSVGIPVMVSAHSSLYSLKASNPANHNQLTAANWDALITEVEQLRQQLGSPQSGSPSLLQEIQTLKTQFSSQNTSSSNASIPAGAVMAFDLSTCPAGWTRFSKADNRFIMGANAGFGQVGGNSKIMIQANQIAPHSHIFKDTVYLENTTSINRIPRDPLFSFNRGYGSSGTDDDNSFLTIFRRTEQGLYKEASTNTYAEMAGTQHNKFDSSKITTQQPLEILNPYIKLIYCKKS